MSNDARPRRPPSSRAAAGATAADAQGIDPADRAWAIERLARALGVSRETRDRLATLVELVRRWQPAVNLIARSTLPVIWSRHIVDSAQLAPLLPESTRCLVDLGSGAGFPGLVLAVLGVPEVHLTESDQRKAAFLREAARTLAVPVAVHACRIDQADLPRADVVTARALAPLTDLLRFSTRFRGPDCVCLFLKGRRVDQELTATAGSWHMLVERLNSVTDPAGTILRLHAVAPV